MIEFGNYSLAAIFVTSIIVLLIASEVRHTIGWRAAEEANVTTLEAANFGLLAPMISLTFSTSLTHFDELAGDGGVADLWTSAYRSWEAIKRKDFLAIVRVIVTGIAGARWLEIRDSLHLQ